MDKKGKITLSIIILSVILVSVFTGYFVLASDEITKTFDTDNLKYGKISLLQDSIKLAEYTLIDNTDECLINCYAEGTATLYTNGYLFEDLRFKDNTDTFTTIDSSKIFILTTEEYQIDIDDYERDCETIKESNGTREECTNKKIGSHKEDRSRTYWKEYSDEFLSPGTYNWKIEGKKDIGNEIDWVASSFGNDFSEWAWWNGTWNKRKTISITGGEETLYDFAVILNVSYDSDMQTDFEDLRFVEGACTEAQDTELSYEFDKVTNSNNALVWVKIPILSTGTNEICMYYGNIGASNGENAPDVWSNNYTEVFHFREGSLNGSLGRLNGSIATGSPTLKNSNCAFGDCYRYDGDDSITMKFNSIQETTPQYIEMFGNSSLVANQYAFCIPAGDTSWNTPWTDACLTSLSTTNFRFDFNVGNIKKDGVQETYTIGSEQVYFAVGYDGSNSYAVGSDGIMTSSGGQSGAITYHNTNFSIGAGNSAGSYTWHGRIDEIRLQNIIRSSAWVNRTIDNTNFSLFSFSAEEGGSNYTITFNLTDSYNGESIDTSSPQDSFDISCDNGFSVSNVENPYTATDAFSMGTWECTFSDLSIQSEGIDYTTKTREFTVTQNETIEVSMNRFGGLTPEEHDWLEAVHNCLINGIGCYS